MFGFEARNNSGALIITSSSRHLVFRERIAVVVTNTVVDRQSSASASFSSPIKTQAAPCIFLRVTGSRHSSMSMYCVVLGSPGNWTGFRIYAAVAGGNTLPRYELDCVICSYEDVTVSGEYGMAIYDENGKPVFAHNTRPVKYSKFTKNWTMTMTAPGYNYYTFNPVGLVIEIDDYIDVSSINRGVIAQYTDGTMFTSIRPYVDWAPALSLATQSAFGLSRIPADTVSALCFGIPICKFPADIYK